MKRVHTPAAVLTSRMKRLPRRHRIAHLRALIVRQPIRSLRRMDLVSLLRREWAAPAA